MCSRVRSVLFLKITSSTFPYFVSSEVIFEGRESVDKYACTCKSYSCVCGLNSQCRAYPK